MTPRTAAGRALHKPAPDPFDTLRFWERLAAFLCHDAQEFSYDHGPNPTLEMNTPYPACPRHRAMANRLIKADQPTDHGGHGARDNQYRAPIRDVEPV
jgi:hypothetical protein